MPTLENNKKTPKPRLPSKEQPAFRRIVKGRRYVVAQEVPYLPPRDNDGKKPVNRMSKEDIFEDARSNHSSDELFILHKKSPSLKSAVSNTSSSFKNAKSHISSSLKSAISNKSSSLKKTKSDKSISLKNAKSNKSPSFKNAKSNISSNDGSIKTPQGRPSPLVPLNPPHQPPLKPRPRRAVRKIILT